MIDVENLILGAGISGVSASFHIGHEKCLLLEKNAYSLGILQSEKVNGYTWDQGPHVSFTKHEYVRDLFAKNVEGKYHEHEVAPSSYYKGIWLDHPVQSNLYQLPEDIKKKCVDSFLDQRNVGANEPNSNNYKDWLIFSLGKEITERFISAYTRKYWTTEPEDLTIDWIGPRIHVPNTENFLQGAVKKLDKSSHYITKVRYPEEGGYQSFVEPMTMGANILNGHKITKIDLKTKIVSCENGTRFRYKKLLSSIPLPIFISLIDSLDVDVKKAAKKLNCSKLLLVNVEIPHKIDNKEHWMYVYDEDKYTTRITIMDNLSEKNSPKGTTAAQIEVYFSNSKPLKETHEEISKKVIDELFEMGVIKKDFLEANINYHNRYLEYANIIFDHDRKSSLDLIFNSLVPYGFKRKSDDLDALTDWKKTSKPSGDLFLLGRFGEWKYYWSDDCVMAGKSYEGLE